MTDTKSKTPSQRVLRSNTRAKKGTKTSLSIQLIEEVDAQIVKYLVFNFDTLPFKSNEKKEEDDGVSKQAQKTLLQNYEKKIRDGKVATEYYQKNGTGRYFSPGSMQGMSRKLRHTIAKARYYDIDIKNAHPVLLEHYCKKNNLECTGLSAYNLYRDDRLKNYVEKNKCDRGTAKAAYLSIINGGGGQIVTDDLEFNNLRTELSHIRQEVMKLNPKFKARAEASDKAKRKADPKNHFSNVDGSCVNHLLCHLENECLMEMYRYSRSLNVDVGVLVFDGLMIRKGPYDLNDFLRRMEAKVFESLAVRIVIEEKPMDEGVTITQEMLDTLTNHIVIDPVVPVDEQPPTPCFYSDYTKILTKDKPTVGDVQEYMMGCLVLIDSGGNSFWMTRTYNSQHTCVTWVTVKTFPFSTTTTSLQITVSKINKKGETEELTIEFKHILQGLRSDPRFIKHCTFTNVAFKPYLKKEEIYPGMFNLFNGFKWEFVQLTEEEYIATEEYLEPFLDHIKVVWANNDDSLYLYIIGWFADLIQHPAKKSDTCPVGYGKEGTGKSIVVEYFGDRVIGRQYYLSLNSLDQLTQKHNSLLQGRLFTVLNEVQSYGDIKGAFELTNKLKDIITCKTLNIEPKGLESYTIDDFNSYIKLSNNFNSVQLSAQARRYFAFECSDSKIGDQAYFIALAAFLDREETAEKTFRYLSNYKVPWNARNIPDTDYRNKLKDLGIPSPIKFMIDIAHQHEDMPTNSDNVVASLDLFQQYEQWCNDHRIPVRSETSFGIDLHAINMHSQQKMCTRRKEVHGIMKDIRKQAMTHTFTLQELRDKIQQYRPDIVFKPIVPPVAAVIAPPVWRGA